MTNKTIALDADGVLLHFRDKFTQCAREYLGHDVVINPHAYSLDKMLGIPTETTAAIWDYFSQTGGWREIEPLPGASESIRILEQSGYEIHVVTAIPAQHRDDRILNFQKFGFYPKSIHCVDFSHNAKHPPVLNIAPHIFVDDRLEHLHSNQQVPVLVWIDLGIGEQIITQDARHDVHVHSLLEWTDMLLANESEWLAKKPITSSTGKLHL